MPKALAPDQPYAGRDPRMAVLNVNVHREVKELLYTLAGNKYDLGSVVTWLARSEIARREERQRLLRVLTAADDQEISSE